MQVILLDVTMPRMSGEETLQRLRKIRRDVPVILMSGFPEEVLLSQFGPLGVSVMLQKPFRPSDVLAAVKRILST